MEGPANVGFRFVDSPDVRIMKVVGEQMPKVIRGETTILEHLLPTGLLDEYYVNALGFPQFSKWLVRMAAPSQGFTEHSYDMIFASFVIHATKKLEHTMRNVRRLLKPVCFDMSPSCQRARVVVAYIEILTDVTRAVTCLWPK